VKKLSTILLNSVLLVIVSCSSPAKEIISDSFLESTDKSSAYSKCLDNCLVEKSLQLNKEISEPDEEKSVFQIKGVGCKSLQYGTGFFVEENIAKICNPNPLSETQISLHLVPIFLYLIAKIFQPSNCPDTSNMQKTYRYSLKMSR
jgi:hypothetical protein